MTLKEDYINFSLENNYIISKLKEEGTLTYDLLEPVVEVLNFIVSKDMEIKGETEEDVIDVFSNGFHYLYQELDHIKRILNENFDDDIDEFIEYDQNMYLYLKLDEVDTLIEESSEIISGLLDKIGSTFEYRKKLDDTASEMIETEMDKALMDNDCSLTADMFMDLADNLGISLI